MRIDKHIVELCDGRGKLLVNTGRAQIGQCARVDIGYRAAGKAKLWKAVDSTRIPVGDSDAIRQAPTELSNAVSP